MTFSAKFVVYSYIGLFLFSNDLTAFWFWQHRLKYLNFIKPLNDWQHYFASIFSRITQCDRICCEWCKKSILIFIHNFSGINNKKWSIKLSSSEWWGAVGRQMENSPHIVVLIRWFTAHKHWSFFWAVSIRSMVFACTSVRSEPTIRYWFH